MDSRNYKNSCKKRCLNHIGKVSLSLVSVIFLLRPYTASAINSTDAAAEVIGSEGDKQVLNEALKIARSKPALSVATAITCVACVPVAGAVASPGMCIACGILIAKTLG